MPMQIPRNGLSWSLIKYSIASNIPLILKSCSLQLKKSPTRGNITLSAFMMFSGLLLTSILYVFLLLLAALSREFFNEAKFPDL